MSKDIYPFFIGAKVCTNVPIPYGQGTVDAGHTGEIIGQSYLYENGLFIKIKWNRFNYTELNMDSHLLDIESAIHRLTIEKPISLLTDEDFDI